MGLPGSAPSIDRFSTVEATCNGVPVRAFGYTWVYDVSPDFLPGLRWQDGADDAGKLVPRKSWEIAANPFGSTPAREPKSIANDDQPLLSVHLVDGDPETCWCSRGMISADAEPVWIRIDLPVETEVREVRIVPSPTGMRGFAPWPPEWHLDNLSVGQAMPRHLEVRVSRDAASWDTVFTRETDPETPATASTVAAFDARPVKQVVVRGRGFPEVLTFGHCFSIAAVEVISAADENVALHSRGAGVTVSSTHLGYGMDRFTQDMLWPVQYDLGLKWTRVGYDMSVFQWAYVEREKGVLRLDPRADAAITEAVDHGVEVVMVLDKGNWLHAPQPRVPRRNRELMETYFNHPPKPDPNDDPDYFAAWLDYVRFMVRHFEGRVRYFEIWNEWGQPPEPDLLDEQVASYCRLAAPTAELIRGERPDARIILASPGGLTEPHLRFLEECLRRMPGLFDVAGYHPYYNASGDEIRRYPAIVADLRNRLSAVGFDGELMATEWSWFATYPPTDRYAHTFTEMQKAKIAARFLVMNAALGIVSFWNETFQTQMTSRDVSLFRNGFSANPVNTTQPQPVYYALRTLATALEAVEPAAVDVTFSSTHPDLECHAFRRGDEETILVLWLAGEIVDDASRSHETDLVVADGGFRSAVAIDSLNGTEHQLRLADDDSTLPGLTVRDWPLVIVLRTADV